MELRHSILRSPYSHCYSSCAAPNGRRSSFQPPAVFHAGIVVVGRLEPTRLAWPNPFVPMPVGGATVRMLVTQLRHAHISIRRCTIRLSGLQSAVQVISIDSVWMMRLSLCISDAGSCAAGCVAVHIAHVRAPQHAGSQTGEVACGTTTGSILCLYCWMFRGVVSGVILLRILTGTLPRC